MLAARCSLLAARCSLLAAAALIFAEAPGHAACGDQAIDPGEDCDDGNLVDGDGCEADCTATWVCGNGQVEVHLPFANEECDQDDPVPPYGATTGCTVCTASCTWDDDACRYCGDGALDASDGELCDDGNAVAGDGCDAACEPECACGDGLLVLACGEACDDGGQVAGDGCDASCQVEPACGFECPACVFECSLDELVVVPGGEPVVVNGWVEAVSGADCHGTVLVGPIPPSDLVKVSDTIPTGDVAFPIGQRRSFTVTLRAKPGMTGPVYDRVGVTLDGNGVCQHVAEACPIPATESSLPGQWAPDHLAYGFRGLVAAGSTVPNKMPRFLNRLVEEQFPSLGQDTCFDSAVDSFYELPFLVPGSTGRGPNWIVEFDNEWGRQGQPGSLDFVGTTNQEHLIWYRGDTANFTTLMNNAVASGEAVVTPLNTEGCGWIYQQHMELQCSNGAPPGTRVDDRGAWATYEQHPVKTWLYPDRTEFVRDDLTMSWPWP